MVTFAISLCSTSRSTTSRVAATWSSRGWPACRRMGALAGLDPAAYGKRSMRRTKVALVYKLTGNLRACQLLVGHGKLEHGLLSRDRGGRCTRPFLNRPTCDRGRGGRVLTRATELDGGSETTPTRFSLRWLIHHSQHWRRHLSGMTSVGFPNLMFVAGVLDADVL